MDEDIRGAPRAGDYVRRLMAYVHLNRIDWIVTAVAFALELINIMSSLITVLAGVRWQALGYLVIAFVLLLWRQRFPKLVLVAVLLHQALFVPIFHHELFMPPGMVFNPNQPLSIPYIPLFGVLVALISVGSSASLRTSALLCIPAAVLPTLIFSGGRPWEAPAYVVASILWAGGAWAFGRFVGRSSQRITDLEAERLRMEAAMEAERAHIAAELHDIVSHAVTVMLLHAAGGRRIIDTDPARAAKALEVIATVGTEATQELSRLLGLLKANQHMNTVKSLPTLEDIAPLVEAVQSAGIDVELSESGTPARVDASVGHTAYRAVQEALTNVSKHVGPGTKTTVAIEWKPDLLQIDVSDTGPAMPISEDRATSGYGLLGLQERVAVAGGKISWGPRGRGFFVSVSLPVTKQREGWYQPTPS
ncbi:sensor histidine kinase [Paenarthrobacter nitroguajacolicus]